MDRNGSNSRPIPWPSAACAILQPILFGARSGNSALGKLSHDALALDILKESEVQILLGTREVVDLQALHKLGDVFPRGQKRRHGDEGA